MSTARIASSPITWLTVFTLMAAALLASPLWLPLGPNYWDLYTYVDTAYRLQSGQLPNVDFFVPVGPLGYYLYAAMAWVFPKAHTLLAVHYAILPLALPLMVAIAYHAARRSRAEALALVIPFVIFAGLPINTVELYPSPGFDGFGNYNRHTSLLLYLLSAALLFVDNRKLAGALALGLLSALFFTKITGFAVGMVIVLQAGLAGRISLRTTLATALAIAVILAAIEVRSTLISHYLEDISELAHLNSGTLMPRILTVLSLKLNVILPAVLLIAVIAWNERTDLARKLSDCWRMRDFESLRLLADHDVLWLTTLLLAGFVFETQNTGSHEFILIWPALLLLLRRFPSPWTPAMAPALVLVAAVALPTPLTVLHRAARAVFSMPKYERVEAPLLGPLGRVTTKPDILMQSQSMLTHYRDSRGAYEQLARRGVLPSYIFFSEIDFQVSWLISVQQAAEALLRYEAANNRRFERIVTLDFVDPLPFMLGRKPLRDVSIGNDPTRTLANLGPKVLKEMASADAILLAKCPPTEARNAIEKAYEPAYSGRKSVELTPCFVMLLKD